MNAAAPKYDVAISFLAADEPLAASLSSKLEAEGLSTFFFPHRQDVLAGTNGLETMRLPFEKESRINTILYRTGWGETPWTRVESKAIQDRCLAGGWETVFFVNLAKTAPVPIWLPKPYVRFNLEDFGLEQAVGALKARVLEQGGEFRTPSAESVGKVAAEEARFIEDRRNCFRDHAWIFRNVVPAVERIVAEIVVLSEHAKAAADTIYAGYAAGRAVITDRRISLSAAWRARYQNSIETDAAIEVVGYNAALDVPEGPMFYRFSEPRPLRVVRFLAELSPSRELRWVEEGSPGTLLSDSEVADACARMFLDLVRQANRGEIDFSE